MLQPISVNRFNCQPIYNNKSSLSFKDLEQVAEQDVAVQNVEQQNQSGSDVFIKYLEKKDEDAKKEKKDGLILSAVFMLAAIGSIFLMPTMFKSSKKSSLGNSSSGLDLKFESLKDNTEIPILDTCKSISKKLKAFLENQVAYAKATEDDLIKTGMPKSANRLLMYGEPGSGKSFFAKIFAKTLDAEYMEIKYSDINKRYCGEHLENMKNIFDSVIDIAKRNPNKKYVVNFNEIDALAQSAEALSGGTSSHSSFKLEERSVFLTYIEDLAEKTPNVTLIASTNLSPKNSRLDGAVMSRFKNVIEVNRPDKECMFEALKANLKQLPEGEEFINSNMENLEKFSESLVNRKASYRDLNNIIDASKNQYLRDTLKDKNSKYKFEYLETARDSIELTDGEIFSAQNSKITCS